MDKKLKDYYDGLLSPEAEIEVQKWLAVHGREDGVTDTLRELFDGEENLSGEQLAYKRIVPEKKSFWRSKMMVACVAVLLAVGAASPVAYFIGRKDVPAQLAEVEWFEYKVPAGENHRMVLPDSSEIYLNAGSRITYPSRFDGNERKVFIDGEVYANITSDPEHPFIINSGDTRLKVYGTTFNYKTYSESECVEVLLLKGSVSLDVNVGGEMKTVQMAPGYMVQYDRKTRSVDMQSFDQTNYRAFSEKHSFHFFNLTMSDIALDLSRYFGVRIVVQDEKLAKTHFYAYFTNNETLEQILSSMNTDGKMRIKSSDGVIYLSSR
ncbi:MAG: FecR family protein [Candidatus Cryptobacteroides sp.]